MGHDGYGSVRWLEPSASGTFFFVSGATGTAGGFWADTFGLVQDAVDAASAASGGEVWLA